MSPNSSPTTPIAQGPEGQRRDIQALRGLAIGLVLLYHAELIPALGAGHLGVDIFFVVSGFLITGIVQRGLIAGTFSFAAFYFRRAKRLLPAAYVVFLACVLAAPLFLTQLEFRDFTWQLLGAVTFTGNIALWMQTGYFETAAELKPLLHVWSLSIEEQYYLLLPATLAFTPRRWWGPLAIAITAGSLALCLLMVEAKPGAVFYLLPTRAWELGLGSLGALLLGSGAFAPLWRALFWPALATLLWVPFRPLGGAHPGVDALLVCSATLVVILRRHPWVNKGLPVRALAWLGDISYSLYLVHWPLLAFAANAWVSDVPAHVRASLAALSVLLAWALYRWVEDPIRRSPMTPSPMRFAAAAMVSATLIGVGFGTQRWDAGRVAVDFESARRGNLGLDEACESGTRYTAPPECRSREDPKVLLWGDSYAMHLADAIEAGSAHGLMQATKTTCAPAPGISVFRDDGSYNRSWGLSCLSFNDSVLETLSTNSSIEVVVLASFAGQLLEGNRVLVQPMTGQSATQPPIDGHGSTELAAAGLKRAVDSVRRLGRRVVIVSPPPVSAFDIGRCIELRSTGRHFFGADSDDCALDVRGFLTRQQSVLALLDLVAREADVAVIRLDEWMCDESSCKVELDGVPLYRDHGHLSHNGSRILGERMRLAERIWAEAR